MSAVRLGVYADLVYRRSGETLSTDRAFVQFVTALADHFDEIVLFGRVHPEPGLDPYVLPTERVRLVPLPHYPSVNHVPALLRSLRRARRTFVDELPSLDAVWIFGPYPVSLVFVQAARSRGARVFLGVRQDFPEYVRNRLPSRRWAWAVLVAHAFERVYRRLARTMPAVVVGDALGRAYGRGGASVLATGFALVRRADLVPLDDALVKPWNGALRILTVGRVDREKNPLLLAEIVALLPGRWTLDVVGTGPLEDDLRLRAEALGVIGRIRLRGYVRNGPELWDLYRSAHAFLHVSLTEGLPQVLLEAQAMGLPIVGTDVGGVADALERGRTGLLVPPGDAHAAAIALERLVAEPELRTELVRAGHARAREQSLEAQAEKVAAFLRANL